MGLEEFPAARGPSRIIIADDHPLFRAAIRQTLKRHPDLEVVAEAANGREAVELCRRLRPGLVLMDMRMPEMDGVAATRAIKRELPDTLVLVLTAVEEPTGLSGALEAGAAGYVLKDAPAARISDAVRRVLAGERVLDGGLAARLLMRLIDGGAQEQQREGAANPSAPEGTLGQKRGGPSSCLAGSLTPREVEVLRLVVHGQTNQQIARNLLMSVSTVKRHIRHISAKLGVCDRVQAAVRAVELGLLDEPDGE
jgi:DNA-binding NarL/FixJ family response regulator